MHVRLYVDLGKVSKSLLIFSHILKSLTTLAPKKLSPDLIFIITVGGGYSYNLSYTSNAKKLRENRIGKTRNLFKKIGGIQGTFHTRMGMIKDGNGKDLKEAEEIKKRQ